MKLGRVVATMLDAPMRGRVVALILVAVAVIAQLSPALGAALIFDRAAIDAGEYWRIATGSLVHFSWAHLAGDAMVLVVASWLLDERPGAEVAALLLGAAAASGLAVLIFAPELRWYGGLSGLAHGAVVYVALGAARECGWRRALSCLTLIIIASKLALDAGGVRVVSGSHLGAPVVVADMSHRGGIAYALVFFVGVTLWTSVRARRAVRVASVSRATACAAP